MHQKATMDVEEMKCECTKLWNIDTQCPTNLCHRYVSSNQWPALTDKEAKLTAKYRPVCGSDLFFLFYHNGFVGLLFRCSAEQSKSFTILFG